MADLDLTDKLGGQPKYVWILGGVAVVTGFIYYRNRKQGTTTAAADSTATSLQDGSSGGTGLATSSPYGAPAGTGITSPTPVQSVPTPYSDTTAASKPVLRVGATGTLVTSLQQELAAAGFNAPLTGIFDRRTKQAVTAYQTSRGIGVDGIVGSTTWSALITNRGAVKAHKDKPAKATLVAPAVSGTVTGRSTSKPHKPVKPKGTQVSA